MIKVEITTPDEQCQVSGTEESEAATGLFSGVIFVDDGTIVIKPGAEDVFSNRLRRIRENRAAGKEVVATFQNCCAE